MPDRTIGYIGLGHMGGGMAANLLAKGHSVMVYDLDGAAVQRLVDQGASSAKSPKDLAAACDIIITSLPNSKIVEQVATGPNGIIEGITSGKTYIDMSTIDPDTTRRVGEAMKSKGAEMLDVPVGKGPPQAADGTLTLMIGGDAAVVESCKDVLDTLGNEQFYCGTLGTGITTKIVNNLVSCTVATLLGEAFTMGSAAGLNPSNLLEVMQSTAAGTAHGKMYDKVLDRDFEPGFKVALSHKDLGLASQLAASLGATNLIGSAAYQIQTMAMGMGLGNENQTAVVKVPEEVTGIEVRKVD